METLVLPSTPTPKDFLLKSSVKSPSNGAKNPDALQLIDRSWHKTRAHPDHPFEIDSVRQNIFRAFGADSITSNCITSNCSTSRAAHFQPPYTVTFQLKPPSPLAKTGFFSTATETKEHTNNFSCVIHKTIYNSVHSNTSLNIYPRHKNDPYIYKWDRNKKAYPTASGSPSSPSPALSPGPPTSLHLSSRPQVVLPVARVSLAREEARSSSPTSSSLPFPLPRNPTADYNRRSS